MIQISEKSNGKAIGIKFEGVVTHEDYQKILIPALEKTIKESGPLRALSDLRDFKEMEWQAILDDYSFGMHHIKDFERVALVGDQPWINWLEKFTALFPSIKIKHFKSDQIEKAWEWVESEE